MVTCPNEPCITSGAKQSNTLPDLDKKLICLSQGRRGFVDMIAKGGKMAAGQLVQFIPLGER